MPKKYREEKDTMGTGLVPHIGYDRAAAIAKTAYETGKTVREVAMEEKVLPEETLNRVLEES